MTIYTLGTDRLPDILKSPPKDIDPLIWNALYLDFETEMLLSGELNMLDLDAPEYSKYKSNIDALENAQLEQNLNFAGMESLVEAFGTFQTMDKIISEYPILMLESALENLVTDTRPSFQDLNAPFPAFFINKEFAIPEGRLMGIYVFNVETIAHAMLLDQGYGEEEAKQQEEKYKKIVMEDGEELPRLNFAFIVHRGNCIDVVVTEEDEVLEPIKGLPKTVLSVMRRAVEYSVNVINLINSYAEPGNPRSKADIRIVPHKHPDFKKTKQKASQASKVSIIRVYGKLKDYSVSYNKERRKFENQPKEKRKLMERVWVRGHWRHFNTEYFVNRRGQKEWIFPFFRGGLCEQMRQRVIELKK